MANKSKISDYGPHLRSIKQAALLIGVHATTLRRWLDNGKVYVNPPPPRAKHDPAIRLEVPPHVNVSDRIAMFDARDLEQWRKVYDATREGNAT